MCQHCGCQQFLEKGKEAILKRTTEIVKELRLSPSNADDYECAEAISLMIAPFGLKEDKVYQIASWVTDLHEGNAQVRREEQYQKYVYAFQDLFARLPVREDPKHIATTFHQLEQLAGQLDETTLASIEPKVRESIEAVNHIHEDRTRRSRLIERYGLQ